MASQLELFLPANSYTTHLLSSTRATNEGIAVLEVWSIFPFAIKRILGIKRIFPCSFANKRMRLLTRVYGNYVYILIIRLTNANVWETMWKLCSYMQFIKKPFFCTPICTSFVRTVSEEVQHGTSSRGQTCVKCNYCGQIYTFIILGAFCFHFYPLMTKSAELCGLKIICPWCS